MTITGSIQADYSRSVCQRLEVTLRHSQDWRSHGLLIHSRFPLIPVHHQNLDLIAHEDLILVLLFLFSSTSSSVTVFSNLVAPSVIFLTPTFKPDPPSLETSSYVLMQDLLDRDRESILQSDYTRAHLALLN